MIRRLITAIRAAYHVPQPTIGPWMPHAPGACPVDSDTIVQVRPDSDDLSIPAEMWAPPFCAVDHWQTGRISAYRVVAW